MRLPDTLIDEVDEMIPLLEKECSGETSFTRATAIRYLLRFAIKHFPHEPKK